LGFHSRLLVSSRVRPPPCADQRSRSGAGVLLLPPASSPVRGRITSLGKDEQRPSSVPQHWEESKRQAVSMSRKTVVYFPSRFVPLCAFCGSNFVW
ncbi:Os03g0137500, partial [Oryza sativa Japonica Group]